MINREYKVMVQESSSNHEFLRTARPGTPMNEFYTGEMDGNKDSFVMTNPEGKKEMLRRDKTLFFASIFAILADPDYVALRYVHPRSSSV